jgi:glycogen phosphorylase
MPGTRFSVEIRPVLPQRFERLSELANDLYFSWDRRVRALFRQLDPECWGQSFHNPKLFLRRISQRRLDMAVHDPVILEEYRRVLSAYDTYLEERPLSRLNEFLNPKQDLIAYFCAEYGFDECFPIYAGGLGILAADHCKAMSKLWVPFVAVGILYHQGYFTQRILDDGQQVADHPYIDSGDLPIAPALDAKGNEVRVQVDLPGRHVQIKVWEAKAGHIRLYLLDADVPENAARDRGITYQLYAGDLNTRIQQEIVLGIGGVRALRALGLEPTVWHINEGHAAFLILERCLEHVKAGLDFDSALELVAANTVFTTHTPVPAGHDVYELTQMSTYFGDLMANVGVSESRFMGLGAGEPNPHGFNMTALALRGSRFHNGVSRINGEVASRMEAYIWPQVPADENPIGHVTNGVDVDTFLGRSWVALFDMYKGVGWRVKPADEAFWHGFIDSIPDHVYLSTRKLLKAEMLDDAHHRFAVQLRRAGYTEHGVAQLTRHLTARNLDTLVIGFARRFATYKRAGLLFKNLERLARLMNDPDRPMLFIFAGKAHPDDVPGQQVIRDIFQIGMRPEFQGKIIVLEDYNLSMTRRLLPGIDVLLNTPEYPKEACGTSGMKAGLNGTLNLSVLDGWWGEAYDGENGWAIVPHPELDPHTRDQQESQQLLDILEHEVIPLYYARDARGQSDAWVRKSKASMKSVLPRFNSVRMITDYTHHCYGPAKNQGRLLAENGSAEAKALARWKRKVAEAWPDVRIRLVNAPSKIIGSGEPLSVEVAVFLNGLDPDDVVVEFLLGKQTDLSDFSVTESIWFVHATCNTQGECIFVGEIFSPMPGASPEGQELYKIRVFPCHPMLTHRFECGCMLWL